jgi:hypothetical protein
MNEDENNFLFEMANFNPQHTGLKEVIWVLVKNANHGPRIKIFKDKQAKGESFSVTIENEPRVIGDCFVNSKELENIKKFILLNKKLLIKYWEYQLDTVDLALNIQKV